MSAAHAERVAALAAAAHARTPHDLAFVKVWAALDAALPEPAPDAGEDVSSSSNPAKALWGMRKFRDGAVAAATRDGEVPTKALRALCDRLWDEGGIEGAAFWGGVRDWVPGQASLPLAELSEWLLVWVQGELPNGGADKMELHESGTAAKLWDTKHWINLLAAEVQTLEAQKWDWEAEIRRLQTQMRGMGERLTTVEKELKAQVAARARAVAESLQTDPFLTSKAAASASASKQSASSSGASARPENKTRRTAAAPVPAAAPAATRSSSAANPVKDAQSQLLRFLEGGLGFGAARAKPTAWAWVWVPKTKVERPAEKPQPQPLQRDARVLSERAAPRYSAPPSAAPRRMEHLGQAAWRARSASQTSSNGQPGSARSESNPRYSAFLGGVSVGTPRDRGAGVTTNPAAPVVSKGTPVVSKATAPSSRATSKMHQYLPQPRLVRRDAQQDAPVSASTTKQSSHVGAGAPPTDTEKYLAALKRRRIKTARARLVGGAGEGVARLGPAAAA